jgi:outer membrane protein, multidrug efflux system
MKRRFSAAAAALLAGCAVGPDYEQPETESAASFESADAAVYTAAEPVIAWWQTLDDPLLDEWIETSVLRNHDLRIAETSLRAARAGLGARKLERYPIATSQLSALETEDSAAVSALPDREQRLYDASLDATWELDFFGRVRRSVQAAAAEANAATEALRDTFVIVSGELARTYFEVKGAQYRLEVAQRNAENQRQTFDLTQALLAGGRGTDLDIARARAQLETTLASIPPLESDVNSGMNRLAVLLGESPETVGPALAAGTELPPLPLILEIGDPAGLLRRRPDIRTAEYRLQAETARVGVAVADLFPRVSLLGSVGYVSTSASAFGESDTRRTSFGPFLTWPAFDLGRVRANVNVANANMDAALLRYEQTVLIALEETENALFAFTRARTRQAHLDVAAQASQEAADLARLRYRDGVDSFLNVLDAESRLLEAQDQLAQSTTDTALAFVLLYKALGGGWQAVDERLLPAD